MLGLHLIKNPAGSFSFVGSVPCRLAYVTKAGDYVTDEEVEKNMRLPSSYRKIKSRVFSSIDEAMREAQRLGYNVNSITKE